MQKKLYGLVLVLILVMSPVWAQAKMLLTGASDLVQVITASGVSTIYVHASWADITTTALTPGRTNTQITTATTTTVVGSPAASTQRQVKLLNIMNSHASSSNLVTVQHTDGTTVAILIKYTLLAGETLQWSEDEGFTVIDASGQIKASVNTELPTPVGEPSGGSAPTAPQVWSYIVCKNAAGTYEPCVASANAAHDAAGATVNPLPIGCYANAAAPSDVSADVDITRAWCLRNGALAFQQTLAGVLASAGAGNTGTGVQRVIEATDSQLSAGVGATGDSAASAGGTGSITAKLRLMTTQLDAIQTALQLIDNDQTGASLHHRISVGTTEDEHEVKGSAGRLFAINVTNTNAAVRYLRCANQVIGSTTPGTTTVFYGMAIPAATTGAGYTANFGPKGIAFSTGLTCWLVTGAAETDVAEVAANEINVNYVYE